MAAVCFSSVALGQTTNDVDIYITLQITPDPQLSALSFQRF